jgi:hypothetical protein
MALGFSKENFLRGPGSIWFADAPPASGTAITCDQDGRPSSGTFLAGYTRSGWTWSLGVEAPAEEAWPGQDDISVVAPTSISVTAELAELRKTDILEYLMPAMYLEPTLKHRFNLGSPRRPRVYPCLTVVGRQVDQRTLDPDPQPKQFFLVCIYRCINAENFGFHATRLDYASASFRFIGRPIVDRPPEDQLAQFQTYAAPEATTAAGT